MTAALNTLLQHAERQRDETLGALLQAEEAARRLRLQAEQLLAYRDDYRQRHPAQGGRSASIDLIRCHQDFMARLEQALQQQTLQQHAADGRCTQLRQHLLVQETRVASVRKLLERRELQQRQHGDRQDQRRTDEAAMQQHRRRADAAGGWRLGAEAVPAPH